MLAAGFFRAIPKVQWLPSCRGLVVLDSSQFQHIIVNEGHTSKAYAGDLLAGVSLARRGMMLETLAKWMLQRAYPTHSVQNADVEPLGALVNGRSRSAFHSEWDWIFMNRRVELKSSQLCFDASRTSWRVGFHGVKLAWSGYCGDQPFDDLFLLIYSPNGFYLLKHDLRTGFTKVGVRTESQGYGLQVAAKYGQACWAEALQTILHKLTAQGGCELIDYAAKSDPLVVAFYAQVREMMACPTSQAYEGVPMSRMNPVIRGLRIQEIACEMDRFQNPGSFFQSAKGEVLRNGCRRGMANAAVDWIRDGVRVEVKKSKLSFFPGDKAWSCHFDNIKVGKAYFDELWLAIYHPAGIEFFKHWNWQVRLRSCGIRTAALGRRLRYRASSRDQSPSEALESIKAQLEEDGAEHHCTVKWAAR